MRSFAAALMLLFSVSVMAAEDITSLPYNNNMESQQDVDNARWSDPEPCIGTVTWEPTAGWQGSGAFKLLILDHPRASPSECQTKFEDTEGMGGWDLPGGNGQHQQINFGFLVWFGSTWWSVLDDDDWMKWVVFHSGTGAPTTRPTFWNRHFGAGSDFRVWGPCENAGGPCKDEYGFNVPLERPGASTDDYSFQWPARTNEWVWMEFEAVSTTGGTTTGQNKLYIFTRDGEIAGEFAQTYDTLVNPAQGITSVADVSYYEGASNTDANSYVLFDNVVIDDSYIGPPADFIQPDFIQRRSLFLGRTQ